jgi:hypothetical protein
MSPGRTEPEVSWPLEVNNPPSSYKGVPRNIENINAIKWDDNLQPKNYDVFGTHPESKILFLDVNILDSTGVEPYRGDVLIEGKCNPESSTSFTH